jgi:hypothetical protein
MCCSCACVCDRDGISRQLAFVGFRSVEDATSAKNYFDRTFLDASRISVEVRAGLGWVMVTHHVTSRTMPSSTACVDGHAEGAAPA